MHDSMGRLFAGASRVDITPPSPVMMGGAFMSYRSSQIWDPLYASSAAISDGEKTVILISCDLGDIDEDSVAVIRQKINRATGIETAHIMVSVIHTHNAPYLRGDRSLFKSREDIEESNRLRTFAQEKIPLAAIEAYKNMQPAKMGYGSGTAERCCFNRRYIMSNGRSQMHPSGVDNPNRLKVEGPVDNQVQVVWLS